MGNYCKKKLKTNLLLLNKKSVYEYSLCQFPRPLKDRTTHLETLGQTYKLFQMETES